MRIASQQYDLMLRPARRFRLRSGHLPPAGGVITLLFLLRMAPQRIRAHAVLPVGSMDDVRSVRRRLFCLDTCLGNMALAISSYDVFPVERKNYASTNG